MENIGFSEIVSNIDLKELHWIGIIALCIGFLWTFGGIVVLIFEQKTNGFQHLILGLVILSILFYFRYQRSRNQLIAKANNERRLIQMQEEKERLEQIEKQHDNCNIELAELKAIEFLDRNQFHIIERISRHLSDNLGCKVEYVFRVKKRVYNGYSYVPGDKMYQASLTLDKFSGNYEFTDGELYDPIGKTVQQLLK
ncbi:MULTISPECIES: hypothetical protein [Sphingobacterium]|uniref:hypothetical protein n=1 Tax=Sphingobacterium TaxID=28453 RepID=UPI00257A0A36|nr:MULTISPECIES: hypothetical protein [Sphingobacterium]